MTLTIFPDYEMELAGLPLYQTLPSANITCLDYSPDMMAQAQEKAKRLGLNNVRFQQGDVGALPFADKGKRMLFLVIAEEIGMGIF